MKAVINDISVSDNLEILVLVHMETVSPNLLLQPNYGVWCSHYFPSYGDVCSKWPRNQCRTQRLLDLIEISVLMTPEFHL